MEEIKMKKKLPALLLPIGLIIAGIYFIINRFTDLSDLVAYPMMIISIALMLIGIAYNSYKKHINP